MYGNKIFLTGVGLALGLDGLLGLPVLVTRLVLALGLILIWLDK